MPRPDPNTPQRRVARIALLWCVAVALLLAGAVLLPRGERAEQLPRGGVQLKEPR